MCADLIEKTYLKEAKSEGLLHLSKKDVKYENNYEKLRDEINDKYNLNLNKDNRNEEVIQLITNITKNSEYTSEFGDILFLFQYIEYFDNIKIFRNAYNKRRDYIYNKILNETKLEKFKNYIIYDKQKYKIIEINRIAELLELDFLNKIKYFRGHPNIKYSLLPSIYRNDEIKNESRYFNEMVVRYPNEFINHNSTFEKLTKIQHYEAPTRLLDITSNPLVALFFICEDYKDDHAGELILFDINDDEIKYFNSDTVAIISNIAKMDIGFDIGNTYKREMDEEEIGLFNKLGNIQYLLNEIRHEKPGFLPIINPYDINNTYFVKPVMGNSRILKQEGAFILFGIKDLKEKPAELKSLYKEDDKQIRIVIPSESKEEILKELDNLGINRGTMFPEINNFSSYLRWKYKNIVAL